MMTLRGNLPQSHFNHFFGNVFQKKCIAKPERSYLFTFIEGEKKMKIVRWLDAHLEEVLLVLFSSTMVAVIFLQVVMRQFGNSLSWSEELARYAFIWMTYMGISYGVKKHRHVKVDAIMVILPDKGKVVLNIISNLFFAAFAIFIIKYGFDIANQLLAFGQKSAANQIPMGLVYMATPIGMSLTLIRVAQNLYKLVLTLMGKAEYRETSEAEQILEEAK